MTIKTFIFNPFQENTYLVYDETTEAVIIDAGCLFDVENQQLKCFIEENNLTLKHVLNTHLHLDHQFGNKFLFDTYGIAPEAGIADEFLIKNFAQQAKMFGLPADARAQPLGAYITDGQEIAVGNFCLRAIHVPGHSPGSMAFYNAEDSVVFTGDALFQNSIGRTDLEQGDHATLIRSILQNLLSLPDSTVVYCGHGQTTTIGNEKRFNPYL